MNERGSQHILWRERREDEGREGEGEREKERGGGEREKERGGGRGRERKNIYFHTYAEDKLYNQQ